MWLNMLRKLCFGHTRPHSSARARTRTSRQATSFRPCLEVLEDRMLLSGFGGIGKITSNPFPITRPIDRVPPALFELTVSGIQGAGGETTTSTPITAQSANPTIVSMTSPHS